MFTAKQIYDLFNNSNSKFHNKIKSLLSKYIDSNLPIIVKVHSSFSKSIIEYEPISPDTYSLLFTIEDDFMLNDYKFDYDINIVNVCDILKVDVNFYKKHNIKPQQSLMYVCDQEMW